MKKSILVLILLLICLSCSKLFDPRIETEKVEIDNAACVTFFGNVINEGGSAITERGFCWGINPNPSIADNYVKSDFGPGEYNYQVCDLNILQTYYFRTYAVNADGTFLGNVKSFNISQSLGSKYTDPRDLNTYTYLTIGTQTWMIENLAYLPSVSPSNTGSDSQLHYYVYGYEGTSVSDAKANSNYTTYGVLYNWEAAKIVCPTGWRLPSDEDWKVLEKFLGMSEDDANGYHYRNSGSVGNKLKEAGTAHWRSPNTGDNSSGFTALPGGYRGNPGGFSDLGLDANFWSSSEYDQSYPLARYLDYDTCGVLRAVDARNIGFSVRCLKNE